MQRMIEESVAPTADGGRRQLARSLVLTVALLTGFVGMVAFLALVVAPWAGAAGGCGGG
jgi:hypothetical protein